MNTGSIKSDPRIFCSVFGITNTKFSNIAWHIFLVSMDSSLRLS